MTDPNRFPDRREELSLDVGLAEQALHGQDAALVDQAQQLYGVFDGVGGERGSSEAAKISVDTIRDSMRRAGTKSVSDTEASLVIAVKTAHSAIVARSKEMPTGATTATVAKLVTEGDATYLVWASVGDSRLYLKDNTGNLRQITEDEGEGRHLDSALGIETYFGGVQQHGSIILEKGTDVVLVTDGITGDYGDDLLLPEEILFALDAPNAQSAATWLVDISRKHDDKTAIVIRH